MGGGGQPIPTTWEIRKKRAESLYSEDEGKTTRKSHENPEIAVIYNEFLKEPLSHLSHSLLHTSYEKRGLLVQEFDDETKDQLALAPELR